MIQTATINKNKEVIKDVASMSDLATSMCHCNVLSYESYDRQHFM